MLHQLIRPAILVFSLTLPVWVVFRLFATGFGRKKISVAREALFFILYVYIIYVLLITTFPIPMTKHYEGGWSINMVPVARTLRELGNSLSHGSDLATNRFLENIIGNILLFIPLGILLPMLSRRRFSFVKTLLTAFFFSFAIELSQYFSRWFGNYRSVDVDDIILNTIGAMLGFAIIRTISGKKQ